jgi:hypothetical protein
MAEGSEVVERLATQPHHLTEENLDAIFENSRAATYKVRKILRLAEI